MLPPSDSWIRRSLLLAVAGIAVAAAVAGPPSSVPTRTLRVGPSPDTAQEPSSPAGSRPGLDTLRTVSSQVFRFTNRERDEHGLSQLTPDDGLWRIACRHSADMLSRDFFRHQNPDGEGPADRVATGHRRLIGEAGENLWGQTGTRNESPETIARRVVRQWMHSRPHRKNILRARFSHMGVCILRDGNVLRGTQVFARVRAYLANPLPRRAKAGGVIETSIAETFPPNATVSMYDFWNPETRERVVEPRSFADTLRLPETPGLFRPRFYVPESGRYSIHQGPELRVTAPE